MLAGYLPAQLEDADLAAIVADVITRTGASGMKDMGKVMGAAQRRRGRPGRRRPGRRGGAPPARLSSRSAVPAAVPAVAGRRCRRPVAAAAVGRRSPPGSVAARLPAPARVRAAVAEPLLTWIAIAWSQAGAGGRAGAETAPAGRCRLDAMAGSRPAAARSQRSPPTAGTCRVAGRTAGRPAGRDRSAGPVRIGAMASWKIVARLAAAVAADVCLPFGSKYHDADRVLRRDADERGGLVVLRGPGLAGDLVARDGRPARRCRR